MTLVIAGEVVPWMIVFLLCVSRLRHPPIMMLTMMQMDKMTIVMSARLMLLIQLYDSWIRVFGYTIL